MRKTAAGGVLVGGVVALALGIIVVKETPAPSGQGAETALQVGARLALSGQVGSASEPVMEGAW